ncbi:MAG: nucleotidyltransferase domain-containing protein [Alphaproteobacteria bacterium]|nr:MAG: nucleotidyltransferase domain-containing protein [Alphaproteobacteria bacterium]
MTLATTPPALDHGLSADDLAILRTTLAPYRDRLTRIALYGSRATGRWRPWSDIDLLLDSPLTDTEAAAIRLALEDSLLPVTVDVTLYRTIIGTGLQDHIDTAARELVL